MSWLDRLQRAAYVSPSGLTIEFTYEDVSFFFEKKTTGYEFPDADGTFVQDLGHTSRRYPLRVIFHGDNYDIEALEFEKLLKERGTGTLEHPIYGNKLVVPFGSVTRRDDLLTSGNQCIFDVTFWETNGLIYPQAGANASAQVLIAVDDANTASSETFGARLNLLTSGATTTFKNNYDILRGSVESILSPIADTTEDVKNQFDAINSSIQGGIDELVSDPLTLGFQSVQLIQVPARSITSVSSRLSAYRNLASQIYSSAERALNNYLTADLFSGGYVTSSIVSTINNEFETRPNAIAAAEEILKQFDDFVAWRDENIQFLGDIDDGSSYQQIQEAVALAAGYLVQLSFDLRQERAVVLSRARTIIDMCAEFYGSIEDDILNFFINSNQFTGSEIYQEVKRGRTVVFYI